MKKYIMALIALGAAAFSASAVNYAHSVWVNLTDGTKVEYKFEDVPVMGVEGTDVKITLASTDESVLYPMADIENFTFSKEVTEGVGNLSVVSPSFGLNRETLDVTGLPGGTEIRIYDMAGREVARGKCDASGKVAVRVGSLPGGVYAVKAGKFAFKFTR